MGGHDNLVAMDHPLAAVVLGVGGGLMGGVGGMWVVLGLVPGRGQGHGQAAARVTLTRVGMGWMGKRTRLVESNTGK